MDYIWKYIKYLVKSKHWRGYGIHSPYLFYLVTMIIEDRTPYYRFVQLEKLRSILCKTKKNIKVSSLDGNVVNTAISAWTKKSSLTPSYDQLLFRWTKFFKSKVIVEVGSTVGLTSLYLSTPDSTSRVYSISKEKELSALAQLNFKKTEVKNIEMMVGAVDDKLNDVFLREDKIDFLFFGKEASVNDITTAIQMCENRMSEDAVIVISDPYRTDKREEIWNSMKQIKGCRVDLDMFYYGMIIFNKNLQRESYNLFHVSPLFS